MRKILFLMIFVVVLPGIISAQGNGKTETVVSFHTGIRDDSKNTYRYLEVLQQRGRWIWPDFNYVDFDKPSQYREIFFGGGAVLYHSKRATIVGEGYINQASGPASGNATYFMPWFLVGYRFTPKVSSETVYLTYLPLNRAGRIQHVLERSKLEYDFKHVRVGGGYGAYRFGDDAWQNKPFVTTTLKGGHLGELELWLQRMPAHHAQLQVRYVKVFN